MKNELQESVHLDLDHIKKVVFENEKARTRIERDFPFAVGSVDANDFAKKIVSGFNQQSRTDPLDANITNEEVLDAAIRALGSNSRSWALFRKKKDAIRTRLAAYDVSTGHREQVAEELKKELTGFTSTADAFALIEWKHLLDEIPGYYDHISRIAGAFKAMAVRKNITKMADTHIMICLAGYLGNPGKRWEGNETETIDLPPDKRKLPGMDNVLASEFFRNLGWPGFKPDRHVKRLLDRWLQCIPDSLLSLLGAEQDQLLSLIGKRNKSLSSYVYYSLLGLHLTPVGTPPSEADALIWLLGAYVERSGFESDFCYITTSP